MSRMNGKKHTHTHIVFNTYLYILHFEKGVKTRPENDPKQRHIAKFSVSVIETFLLELPYIGPTKSILDAFSNLNLK